MLVSAPASESVAKFTRDGLSSLSDDRDGDRLEHALRVLDERGAAQALIRQQYAGRYPFELLQNAADAAAEAGRPGRVRFHLSDTALLVADNGAGFGHDQIESICSLGRSSKKPEKSVGYKGLGFKSVGEITDRPQVITADVRFEFDSNRVRDQVTAVLGELPEGQRLPTYAFPFEITDTLGTDAPLVDELLTTGGYKTVMRLPLRDPDGREEVQAHLKATIAPPLMLFLRAMVELELSGTDANFTSFITRDTDGAAERALLETSGLTSEWLVYSHKVPVAHELVAPIGEGWAAVKAVTTMVAVPVGDDGEPFLDKTFPLHVYFPTEEQSGFPFIVHADWALHLDRRNLATTPESAEFNQFMTAVAVAHLADVVTPDLATRFADPAVAALTLTGRSQASGHGSTLHQDVLVALRKVEFVATSGGQLCSPAQAVRLPESCPDPHRTHALANVAKYPNLLVPRLEQDEATRTFLGSLGVPVLALATALSLLQPPPVGSEDSVGFYEHLLEWDEEAGRSKFATALTGVRCLRTRSGERVAPKSRVFFPRRGDGPLLPESLPVPVAAIPDVDGLASLLEAAGVKEFRWREILAEYLVPLLRDPGQDESIRAAAMDGLRAYVAVERAGDASLRPVLASVLLPCRNRRGTKREMVPAGKAYLGQEWTRDRSLEEIYGPFKQVEFVDVPVPVDEEDHARELELLTFLGVATCPRILTVDSGGYLLANVWNHPHRGSALWSQWWADPMTQEAMVCPQGHPASQRLQTSHVLDRFDELVASGDDVQLGRLWMTLATRWHETYSKATEGIMYCQHGSHVGEKARRSPSLLGYSLTHANWVPAAQERARTLVKPSDAWRVDADVPNAATARMATLQRNLAAGRGAVLADDLGVADTNNLNPARLVAFLERAAADAPQDPSDEAPAELVDAAVWALGALERALGPSASRGAGPAIALPAVHVGRRMFATDPLVARDPLLRDTWPWHAPVLLGDDNLKAVPEYFGLVVLDAAVKKTPREHGHEPGRTEDVTAHLRSAAAWMLAVLRQVRPSAQDDFVRRLSKLDVRPCNDLVLEYAYDDVVHKRADAVSYIQERRHAPGTIGSYTSGTAYLELDPSTRMPNWYSFGPQLATYTLAEGHGDMFGYLLASEPEQRDRLVASKQVSAQDVADARRRLDEVLDTLTPEDIVDSPLDDITWPIMSPTTEEREADTEPSPDAAPPAPPAGTLPEAPTTSPPTVGATQPADTPPVSPPPPPPLDTGSLLVEDIEPGPTGTTGPGGGGGGGGGWTPEPFVSEAARRAWGRRGEQAALAAERRRVTELGFDPDVVVWRSDVEQYAAHDIESVGEDGITVYIEVKATTGSDPASPFEISQAELTEAIRHGDQYFVYRVTEVDSARPRVLRYGNPVARVLTGTAVLNLSSARMRFGRTP